MKAQVTETVTIAQAKTALEQTAKLYFLKGPDGAYAIDRRRARPVCLMGPAGIGKTEIVRQVAEEQGLAFLACSVTHHTRQSAIGLPRLKELELEGKTVPVTEYTMSEIIAEVYRVLGGEAPRKTAREADALSFPEQWALVSILLLRLEKLCREGGAEVRPSLENAIRFFSEKAERAPLCDFLMNGITGSDPCAQWITREGSQVYNEAAERVFFGKNAPGSGRICGARPWSGRGTP